MFQYKSFTKKITIIFLCWCSYISFSQNGKMEYNQNEMDSNFVENENIKAEFQKNDKSRIQLIAKIENNNSFDIYLKNNSKEILNLITTERSLTLIQEAKDKNGNWKPIEFWYYSSCGNRYKNKKIASEGIIKTVSKKYDGKFKTEIRFKFLDNNEVFYSNSMICNIDLLQFKTTNVFKKCFIYKYALRISNEKLAERVLFLEVNAMEELLKIKK